MSLFDKIFAKPNMQKQMDSYFRSFTAYQPAFYNFDGMLYESELVRSALDAKARHISKLRVEFNGPAKMALKTAMKVRPNRFQTWSQFLYRLSTILDMQNTAFIVPVLDKFGDLRGYYSLLPSKCEVLEYNGEPWLRYRFSTGTVGAVEFNKCGILTKMQYQDDFFGENNRALNPTMQLIKMQNQGIEEGIKAGASFRFMAKLNNFKSPEDLKREQKAFTEANFSADAGGGVALFPNTYSEIQQIKSSPFTIDSEQMKLIQTNVFNYFGVNEGILQNKAIGDELDAFYEGVIEPFAIQLSEVATNMTFTSLEQSFGNYIMVTANKLQYMTTKDKINFVKELGDRGFITVNEARELLNYPMLPDEVGNLRPLRGEYYLQADDGSITKKDGGDTNDQGE